MKWRLDATRTKTRNNKSPDFDFFEKPFRMTVKVDQHGGNLLEKEGNKKKKGDDLVVTNWPGPSRNFDG